ncbi:MAG TPA: 6-phosphofructokinase [Caldilineae bacterium]|nr:6-phosphofructokinase [Caldilineae bacterium]
MTSGGDAPGMNAAVRAAVRMGLHHGLKVYGIHSGWQGAVDGGDSIEEMHWWSVGGILQRGGTFLGTARCDRFRQREGRLQAAVNLYRLGIDGLVVIGGDGSLTGARILSEEWPDLLQEAAALGRIEPPERHTTPTLAVVGLPGSIDNDTYGSDMSIGADTALHRIVTAADQLASTASAHHRTFIMEVMGRHCGYLALAGAVAAGAHWVLIPEQELDPRWHQKMIASLKRGGDAGRRHNIIIVAEGARHPDGLPLNTNTIKDVLDRRLGIEARVTVLGHVQRGGAPSAFDRVLATRLGAVAVENLLIYGADEPPRMLGIVNNQVHATSLVDVVEKSRRVGEKVDEGDYESALDLRGLSFQDQLDLLELLTRSKPHEQAPLGNILVVTAGHDSPGMNAGVRILTRMALDSGYKIFGATYGFEGLLEGEIRELGWMDVSGWAPSGGSELGAGRLILGEQDLPVLARVLAEKQITAVMLLGGMDAYENAAFIKKHQTEHPALKIPLILIPASINNNLPATEFAIGADTALNNIISALDKIKDTAGSNKRAFVVEVFGHDCGYLALMAALASGAEQVYLPEEGISLQQLADDVEMLRVGFERGKRLSILILNERASPAYNLDMVQNIMEEEGGDLFDVRSVRLGHVQRGGSPSPFDRILAARLATAAVETLQSLEADAFDYLCLGLSGKDIVATELEKAMAEVDWPHERTKQEWFMELRELARIL